MYRDFPEYKLEQADLDQFADEFNKKLIAPEKLYGLLTDIYDRFGKNKFEGSVMPMVCDMNGEKLRFDSRLEAIRPQMQELVAKLNRQAEYSRKAADPKTPVTESEKEQAVEWVKELQGDHSALETEGRKLILEKEAISLKLRELLVQGQAKIKKNRRSFRIIKFKLAGTKWAATLLIILLNFFIAWKADELAEHTEHNPQLQKDLPELLRDHIFFFAVFFLLELFLDPVKDWLKEKLQRTVIRNRFKKLHLLYTDHMTGRKLFCESRGITPEELDRILLDRLYEPK